jgi:hypothetical protein
MKVATVALASALAFGSSLAFAQIDSRINSNTTGADFPPSSSSANHSSYAFWPNSRVVIITKIPPKSGSPTEQPDRAKPSGAHRRH